MSVDDGNRTRDQDDGGNNSQDLGFFKKLLRDQQTDIEDLLKEQKQELIEKVDPEKKHTFRQKNLAKQHEVNKNFENLAKKIQKALDRNQQELAADIVEKLLAELKDHSEDLIVADLSRNGWLTVSHLRNKTSLPTQLLKQLDKLDDQIDKRKSKFSNNEGVRRRAVQVDKETPPNHFKSFKPSDKFQKKSPEQILDEAVKQTRAGKCSHCLQEGHFIRECADFWTKVHENRKAFKK